MKAEQFLLDYMKEIGVPISQLQEYLDIDFESVMKNGKELQADEFIRSCMYLGINPDEVMNKLF